MKLIYSLFFILLSNALFTQQFIEITNHPFTDSLWDISNDGSRIIACGKEGVIASTNSGLSFTEINDFNTPADQQIYNNSVFHASVIYNSYFWICGEDTLNNKGVIFFSNNNNN